MIAIMAPRDILIDPVSDPDAPASESPDLLPADEPTSPGAGPSPGCNGEAVASTEYSEETALDDISGVRTTDVVVGELEFCAATRYNKECSTKLKRKKVFISGA